MAADLSFTERFLMMHRPQICPFHVLMEHVPQGSRVLDIGCGAGLWLLLLSRTGRIAGGTGVELAQAKIDIANSIKSRGDDLEFHALSSETPWPQGEYNCLSMIDVLHHVPVPQQRDFLGRIADTSARTVIFKDIDPKAIVKRRMNSLHDMLLAHQLPRYCEKETVAQWLEQMGFEINHIGRHDMLWYSHYLIVAKRK